jgi:hypothetical protein
VRESVVNRKGIFLLPSCWRRGSLGWPDDLSRLSRTSYARMLAGSGRTLRARDLPLPGQSLASLGETTGGKLGVPWGSKDEKIWVRTGKCGIRPPCPRGSTTSVFSMECIETKGVEVAPQVGFEPTTLRLTAECSTIELLRSVRGPTHSLHQNPTRAVKSNRPLSIPC